MKAARPPSETRLLGVRMATSTISTVTMATALMTYRTLRRHIPSILTTLIVHLYKKVSLWSLYTCSCMLVQIIHRKMRQQFAYCVSVHDKKIQRTVRPPNFFPFCIGCYKISLNTSVICVCFVSFHAPDGHFSFI